MKKASGIMRVVEDREEAMWKMGHVNNCCFHINLKGGHSRIKGTFMVGKGGQFGKFLDGNFCDSD